MILVVIPKTAPEHIIQSQIINRSIFLYGRDNVHFFSEKKSLLLLKQYRCYTSIEEIKSSKHITKVYTRSIVDFFHFLPLTKVKQWQAIYDFRGLISEESFLRNESHAKKWILKAFEYFAFKWSDEVFCVSNNMKNELLSAFGKREVQVVPCCITSEDLNLKKITQPTGKIRFIYVGSLSKWQGFQDACRIYRQIENSNTEFVVVTKDIENAQALLRSMNIQANVKTGSRAFCLSEMAKADFGFIVRPASKINNTASPIKFLEYTSQGVIPIMTKNIGDYSEYFSNESVLIEDINTDVSFSKFTDKLKERDIYQRLFFKSKEFVWEKFRLDN